MSNVDIVQVLKKNNFRFNKAFGQNFLSDSLLLSSICEDARLCESDVVIEIGAGAGSLTREIAKRVKKVFAFEIDRNLKPVLAETLLEFSNVEMIFEDVLKADVSFLKELSRFKVVANLPYYITTPVVMFFLENFENVESVTVMVQKEVAERFAATETNGDYGAISANIAFLGKAEITRQVSRKMFFPEPNVDSAVIRIDVEKKYNDVSYEDYSKTVKAAFAMRRKTLSNNLMSSFFLSRDEANNLIEAIGKNANVRGEELSVSDFVHLTQNRLK